MVVIFRFLLQGIELGILILGALTGKLIHFLNHSH